MCVCVSVSAKEGFNCFLPPLVDAEAVVAWP